MRAELIAVLLAVMVSSWLSPVVAAPAGAAPTEQDDRGRRDAQRDAEQRQRELQREAEQRQRELQRDAEQRQRELQRDAEHRQRELQREAAQAQREAQREAEETWREAQRDAARYQWDAGRSWVERVVEVPAFGQSYPVTLALPQTGAPGFLPNFTNAVQRGVLPPLLQTVPPDVFSQAPLQFWPVQPNAFGMAHPSLYWGPDDYVGAQQFVSQLGVPGFQPMAMQGPSGPGVYLVVLLRLQ